MRRFRIIIGVVLIAILMIAMVACNHNDDNETPKIEIKEGMTVEQIMAELDKVEYFAIELSESTSKNVYSYEVGKYGYTLNATSGNGESELNSVFYDGNKYYDLSDVADYEQTVIDVTGYDVDNEIGVKSYKDSLFRLLTEKNITYSIEDNKLIVYSGVDKYVFKDFNEKEFQAPSKFDGYKDLAPNKTVLEYTNLTDSTCKIESVNVRLKSFQIPEEYEGKTVTEVDFNYSVANATVPKTVQYISGIDSDTEINYGGTKEEWMRLKSYNGHTIGNVHCADGNIENGTFYFTSEMDKESISYALRAYWNIESFTSVVDGGEEYGTIWYKFTNNGESGKGTKTVDWHAAFFENDIAYIGSGSADGDQMKVVDLKDYDYNMRLFEDSKRDYLYSMARMLLDNDYAIVDGNIVISNGDGTITLKDFGKTELDIPDKYKDYKNLEVNTENAVFLPEGDGYVLTDVNVPLVSYTVPDTYNGKPVVAIDIAWLSVQKVCIPTSVVRVGDISYPDYVEVEYLGTKVQWMCVQKGSDWEYREVTCKGSVDESGATIKSGMSKEEILNAVKNANSFTFIEYDDNDYNVYKYAFNGTSAKAGSDYGVSFKIYEKNACYEFSRYDGEESKKVYDLTDYDFNDGYMLKEVRRMLNRLLDYLYSEYYETYVENDVIVLSCNGLTMIIRDIDTTTLDIPDEFKDYKDVAPNTEVEIYNVLSDTECELYRLNVPMKTYVVAGSYGERTITSIGKEVFAFVENITIPKTVTTIDIGDMHGELTIEYKGTATEWESVEKSGDWTGVKIVCLCID